MVLPVSTDELAVHPGGGLDVTLSYQSRRSRYSLNVATDHRHSWESEVEAALQYQYGPALSAAVGYHYTKGWSGFPSQYMQEERYNGLYFAADYDGNLLFTSYRYYPQSGFSYGYIGFDVLAFSTPKTFQQNDLTITHGLFYELDGSPQRLTAIEVGPAVLSLLYMSGPIDDTHRHNIGEYTLSYHWHLFPHNTFLRPSIEAGAGIKRFNLVQHFDETVLEEVRPALSLEVALGLGRDRFGLWPTPRIRCRWVRGSPTSLPPRALLPMWTDTIISPKRGSSSWASRWWSTTTSVK